VKEDVVTIIENNMLRFIGPAERISEKRLTKEMYDKHLDGFGYS
jgi:hypothetical protein